MSFHPLLNRSHLEKIISLDDTAVNFFPLLVRHDENETTIARIAVGKLVGARWKRAIDVENSDTAYTEQRLPD